MRLFSASHILSRRHNYTERYLRHSPPGKAICKEKECIFTKYRTKLIAAVFILTWLGVSAAFADGMAGVCSDYEVAKTEEEITDGITEEELPIDGDTSLIFQSVCEKGLHESEKDLTGKEYPFSVRKTLNIFLEDKRNGSRESVDRLTCNYAPDKYPLYGKPASYDMPYILDAAASDDGHLLRLIVKLDFGDAFVYQYDLQSKNGFGTDKKSAAVFRKIVPRGIGQLKQAYFVFPDAVKVCSDTGCEYSAKIGLVSVSGDESSKSDSGTKLFLDCISWNQKGSRIYLHTLFAGGADLQTLTVEPPVPTEKDWEGWRKLVRHPKDK